LKAFKAGGALLWIEYENALVQEDVDGVEASAFEHELCTRLALDRGSAVNQVASTHRRSRTRAAHRGHMSLSPILVLRRAMSSATTRWRPVA
jgi:hypothetical protein